MLSCGMSCVKYLLFSFNLLFVVRKLLLKKLSDWKSCFTPFVSDNTCEERKSFALRTRALLVFVPIHISGMVIASVALFALHDISYYDLFFGGSVLAGSMLLVTVGVIVFIVAFFGCYGALKENRFMVITVSIFMNIMKLMLSDIKGLKMLLFIIFIMEIGGGITAYVLKDVLRDEIDTQLNSTLSSYKNYEDIRRSWDILQTDFHCCGVNGPDDWANASLKIPTSCCDGHDVNEPCKESVYQKGCVDLLEKFISQHAVIVCGVGVGIAFIQVVGIILACSLAESIKKRYQAL
ncbi:23 kDa integral membrane protein-like [Schistocerca serialis cubense]|uniref:23 kDa integral membrane protein-like n=1 Tax=Schistocerca serialis cubense TaxID=2023355 RepID=UPI00214E85D3|nr:23 kDa integral membrane protein-like [Schistocerca serialis cubense]